MKREQRGLGRREVAFAWLAFQRHAFSALSFFLPPPTAPPFPRIRAPHAEICQRIESSPAGLGGRALIGMGISHPLADEYDALRGAVLSPERTPPSSPPPPPSSCCAPDEDYLEHQVSRMDTLAGIAIKYGVEISDIKRANSLVSDTQMFALKTLLIPLPGKPIPSSARSNGTGQSMKRAWAPSHQQKRESPKSGSDRLGTSPAMSTLQRYYGLIAPQKVNTTMDCSTEMCVYHKGSFQSETLLINTMDSAAKSSQDGSVRRRQKLEADTHTRDDFLSDPIKAIKSLLPRPISSIRLNGMLDTDSSRQKSSTSISFLNGLRSMRKSTSAPNFADTEKPVSSSTYESFTRPLLDGLPKPVSARRTKTAMD